MSERCIAKHSFPQASNSPHLMQPTHPVHALWRYVSSWARVEKDKIFVTRTFSYNINIFPTCSSRDVVPVRIQAHRCKPPYRT
eukprot:120292-Amphidinium_carterae.1